MKLSLVLCLLPGFLPLAFAQEILDEAEPEITTASEAQVGTLLARHGDAVEARDAMLLGAALAAMSAHDNPEFLNLALGAVTYRATTTDKREAKRLGAELGTPSKKDVDALIAQRESEVQVACAHILANFGAHKKVPRALMKLYGDKQVRKDKPAVTAAAIRGLGQIGYHKAAKDIARELDQASSKEVAGAAVRYFGQIKTKDYSIVRKLCGLLTPPEPGAVNSASNPPAGYWAARWEVWSWTRREVTWTLKQITGQVFRPAEGEHKSDTKKALEYIKANKRQLGLK
jgi:hypothetical protein